MTSNLKHDALIKKILTNPVAAQEFLEYYLPADFKTIVDLTKITIEKESFVEEDRLYGVKSLARKGKLPLYSPFLRK
ncbi:Rpn family recombination-promoting nuclease/putative transposase [Candidatus Cardinium hertigii]|uniref:Rpn family recombination-promoting nuclease/putative transposase n=1 Tax=Candidatus Cardinium hertigii TaxID=247481 RepID=UPI001C8640B3|nr:Rpn family recombination-promoting nuclease/putative transposase [Candidatus Cardinium hertigii]